MRAARAKPSIVNAMPAHPMVLTVSPTTRTARSVAVTGSPNVSVAAVIVSVTWRPAVNTR